MLVRMKSGTRASGRSSHGRRKGLSSAAAARRAKDARSLRSKRIILDVATDLFNKKGYAGFSINAIVEKTGIAKTTIYRHWPTQGHLLTEIIKEMTAHYEPADRGNLRDDLITHFVAQTRFVDARKNHVLLHFPELLKASGRELGSATVLEFTVKLALNMLRTILERARVRGEVPPHHDLDTMGHLIFGAIVVRQGLLGAALGKAQLIEIVDTALEGIKSPD